MNKPVLPIRAILLAAFLLVGLLPIVLMSALAYKEARDALKSEIKHDIQTRTQATAAEIDRMMFERIQNVASWRRLEIMQDIRFDDVDKRLSNFLQELKISYRGMYVNLYVLDPKGKIIACSDSGQIGNIYSLSKTWSVVKMTQGNINLHMITNEHLPLSAAISNSLNAEMLGQLVVEFNWQQIHQMLNNAVIGSSSAALFDTNNQLLAKSDRWQSDNTQRSIRVSTNANGYGDFAGFNWRLEVVQPTAEGMAPVHRMTFIFILLLIGSIILAVLIGVPVATVITRPLEKLTKFANHISPNATQAPLVGGTTELRALSNAFTKMLTDLALSKEALTQAAKLAVAGEMAAAMSHEIRTPLGILRSSAQVLMREPSLSAESKEICGFILSETERLNALVNTLIDNARPRNLIMADANISALAEKAVAMLLPQAEKKQILLICKAVPNITIHCDADQILQVLLNLIINAIQILTANNKIEVTVQRMDEHVIIKVMDDGPGVPEAFREHIFDPFYTKRSGGIGLGLAVVKQIVNAHYGEIKITDSYLHGAEFQILLPELLLTKSKDNLE